MAWNRADTSSQSAARKSASKSPSAVKGAIAGLAVVAVLGLAAFFIFGGKDAKPKVEKVEEKKPAQLAEVKPAAVSNKTEATKPEEAKKSGPDKEDVWLGTKVDHRVVVTNGSYVMETIYTVDGKKHRYSHSSRPRIFKHTTDQVLALATSAKPGESAPPLPGMSANFVDEFGESLKTEIVINPDDPDDVKELKQRVKEARQGMLEAMASGMTAEEVLQENRRLQEHNSVLRMEAVKGLREYLEKGDVEGAQAYCDKMNVALEGMGIMKIELPRSREEIREERLHSKQKETE